MLQHYKKLTILSLVLFCSFTLAGCWSNRDLAEFAIISAIGIDKADDYNIELTLQIVNSSQMKTGESSGGSSPIKPVTTISLTGNTIADALSKTSKNIDKIPFLSDVNIIIIGEELARDGIVDYLDFFERYSYSKRRAYLLIAKDLKAKEVLKSVSSMDKIPANHMVHIMKNSKYSGRVRTQTVIELIQTIEKPGQDDVVGTVKLSREDGTFDVNNLCFEGGSIIKDGKLIGWLDSDETLALLIIKEKLKNFFFTIPDPVWDSKKATVEVLSVKTKIKTAAEEDQPKYTVDTSIIANMTEIQAKVYEITPEYWTDLENQLRKAVGTLIKDTIKKAQNQYQSDIFGFCEDLRIKNPKLWKKTIENWDDVFKDCPVDVNVKVILKRPSVIKQPLKIREKGD
ncbi:Ger(x)C family spore germination protein [Clostridium thermarum]|uniref:Ger(x)C family spore germination protein n=1 Tax=Clostridium thermarum TaxID=1716543 RepID=UPI00111EC9FB|nr:Ger(x)C family spore germination protein [Clostridium thermarum]